MITDDGTAPLRNQSAPKSRAFLFRSTSPVRASGANPNGSPGNANDEGTINNSSGANDRAPILNDGYLPNPRLVADSSAGGNHSTACGNPAPSVAVTNPGAYPHRSRAIDI